MKKEVITVLIAGNILFLLALLLDVFVVSWMAHVQNSFLDMVFLWITNFVNVFVILVIITTLFLIEEKKKEWIFPLWISFFTGIAISMLIKYIVARPRPMTIDFYPLFETLHYSFPSMHATVAFTTVPLLNKEFPHLKWAWIAFAGLIALSRIYISVHYLSDIVFGAMLGLLIGYGVIFIEKKYKPFAFLQ